MKKPWRQLIRKSLAIALDERYAEMSKNQRRGYWIFVAAVFLMILLVLNSGKQPGSDAANLKTVEKPEQPRTEKECTAKGGKWMLYPMGQFHFCAIDTTDAGKQCSDDRQCQGDCIPAGKEAGLPGICAPTLPFPGGCPQHLVNGRIVVEPCI